MSSIANYRSPFDVIPNEKSPAGHACWVDRRNKYVATGDEDHLYVMLAVVTMNNPPDAPKPVPVRTWTKFDITSVMLILLAAFTISGTFGGFRAVAALAAVLLIIFASSWPG